MKPKTSKAQKRKRALERRCLDRAILRLTRSFYQGQQELSAGDQRELLGLVQARRRVS